jgi:Na+/H+ antiporter NhaD/arsenite permease-like protein
MDQKERQIVVTLISTVLVIGLYVLYVYQKQVAGNIEILNDFRFWGKSFLWLIPVSIVALIVIHIIYAIINRMVTKEDIPTVDDERDRMIELKAIRVSHWIFTTGFICAMGVLAFGAKPTLMFIILFSSGFGASIISELVKLYYYRKGI